MCCFFIYIWYKLYTMDNTKLLQQIERAVYKKGYVETAFPSTTVGTANADSSAIMVDISKMVFGNINMQITWTGFNTVDAIVKLQMSNDGTNWVDVTDGAYAIGAASGTTAIVAAYAASQYVRVDFAKGTNSAGTFGVLLSFK